MRVCIYQSRDDDFLFAVYYTSMLWQAEFGVVFPNRGDAVGEDVDVAVANDLTRCVDSDDCSRVEED